MSDLNRIVRKHKAALTRAQNSAAPQEIIAACNAAFADFDRYGYPDQWAKWERARDDAMLALARRDSTW